MGYTHYWRQKRDFTVAEWSKIEDCAKKLVFSMEGRKTLEHEKKQSDHVRVSERNIVFNGKRKYNLDHETFCLEKDVHFSEYDNPKEGAFNFCKTANKPYDKFVTAMLIAAQSIAPDVLKVTSDGWRDEWTEGQKLLAKYLIADIPATIEPRPDAEKSKLLEELQAMGKLEIIDAR